MIVSIEQYKSEYLNNLTLNVHDLYQKVIIIMFECYTYLCAKFRQDTINAIAAYRI